MTPNVPIKGFVVSICLLAGAVVMPIAAQAAGTTLTHGSVTGNITYVDGSTVTIQTAGRPRGVINALTTAADRLSEKDFPYVYGGGHAEAGVASIGIKGPGYNGRRIGFDCSGSVAAVLAAAGLWPAGSGVPNEAGMIQQLLQEKLIASGPGRAPDEVTLYDDPGVHIFMNIDGRFFGTSDGGGGDPSGGPTWIDDGAPDAWNPVFKRYHVLASVLRSTTTAGDSFTFQTGASPVITAGAELGDKVTISYGETRSGSMTATAIQYAGARTVTAAVSAIAPNGSAVTVQTAGGATLTFTTAAVADLIDGVQVGDDVQVTYSTDVSGLLIPHALAIVSTPAPAPPTSPTPPVTAPGTAPPLAPAGRSGPLGVSSSSGR